MPKKIIVCIANKLLQLSIKFEILIFWQLLLRIFLNCYLLLNSFEKTGLNFLTEAKSCYYSHLLSLHVLQNQFEEIDKYPSNSYFITLLTQIQFHTSEPLYRTRKLKITLNQHSTALSPIVLHCFVTQNNGSIHITMHKKKNNKSPYNPKNNEVRKTNSGDFEKNNNYDMRSFVFCLKVELRGCSAKAADKIRVSVVPLTNMLMDILILLFFDPFQWMSSWRELIPNIFRTRCSKKIEMKCWERTMFSLLTNGEFERMFFFNVPLYYFNWWLKSLLPNCEVVKFYDLSCKLRLLSFYRNIWNEIEFDSQSK